MCVCVMFAEKDSKSYRLSPRSQAWSDGYKVQDVQQGSVVASPDDVGFLFTG